MTVVRQIDQYQELEYPFIAIENVQDNISVQTIDNYGGEPMARMHLWSTADDLQAHDRLYIQMQQILMKVEYLPSYRVSFANIDTNDLNDTTANTDLQHTIIDATYRTI